MVDNIFFRVHRSALLPALDAVFEAVDQKSTIPILGNVLLRPRTGELTLRGTDLTIEVETSCDLLDEGQKLPITVSGTALREIVRNAPESAEISFAPGAFADQVLISAGKSKFSLLTLPERDFPSISDKIQGDGHLIDLPPLLNALAKVTYAIREDKTRPHLSGPFIHPDNGKISVVGCDGHNLAVIKLSPEEVFTFPGAILPLKTVKSCSKIFTNAKGKGRITITDAMIRISCDGISLVSKLIDATFPNYAHIIPARQPEPVVSSVAVIKSATTRVCLVSTDLEKDSVFLDVEKNLIKVTMSTGTCETAEEEIAVSYSGEPVKIGFNGKYIRALLGSISTQDVELHIIDQESAALFRPTIDVDESYVLMPRRK